MIKVIDGEDVRKGDKIRISLDFTVGNSTFAEDREIRSLEHDEWIEVPPNATIELLDRPLPEFPTTKGTVLRVFKPGCPDGMWMVQSDGRLVSATNNHKMTEDFREFLRDNDYSFEVIA